MIEDNSNIYPQNLTLAYDDIIYLTFSNGFTTCFIRGSNRLAGMVGTCWYTRCGPLPHVRHEICFMARFTIIWGNNPSQTSWGLWEKKGRFVRETQAPGKRPDLCKHKIIYDNHTHIYIYIYNFTFGKCLGFARNRNHDRQRIIIIITITITIIINVDV